MSVGDVDSDAKGSGARFNDGKVPYELIPIRIFAAQMKAAGFRNPLDLQIYSALLALQQWQEGGATIALHDALSALGGTSFGNVAWDECARVFEYGAKKYKSWNWLKGMQWSIPLGCAVRHLEHMYLGEMADVESGLSHRGHFLCNVCMLIMYQTVYLEGDDRPPMLLQTKPVHLENGISSNVAVI